MTQIATKTKCSMLTISELHGTHARDVRSRWNRGIGEIAEIDVILEILGFRKNENMITECHQRVSQKS